MKPKDKDAPEAGNGFMAVLRKKEITQSKLTELSKKLGEVALAVSQTGKKGSLVLRIDVIPEKGALHFEAVVSTKIPTLPDHLCLFFVSEDGELTRDDPKQKEFDLRTVQPAPGTEVEDAAFNRANVASA